MTRILISAFPFLVFFIKVVYYNFFKNPLINFRIIQFIDPRLWQQERKENKDTPLEHGDHNVSVYR